jgi:hypothetical protein
MLIMGFWQLPKNVGSFGRSASLSVPYASGGPAVLLATDVVLKLGETVQPHGASLAKDGLIAELCRWLVLKRIPAILERVTHVTVPPGWKCTTL